MRALMLCCKLFCILIALCSPAIAQSSSTFTNNTNLSTGALFTFPTGIPANTTIPAITSGLPATEGTPLVTNNGSWTNCVSPACTYSYQWNSSGVIGNFTVNSSGQIISPSGKVFVPRGVVFRFVSDLPVACPTSACAPLTSAFPGINFVRLFYGPVEMSFTTLQTYINDLTALGIVVELQDAAAGEANTNFCVLTGSALTTSTDLVAGYATTYKNNPYVWFVSQNEPDLYNLGDTSTGCTGSGTYNLTPITTEQIAYYNAVRGAGNNSIFIVSASGSARFETFPSAVMAQYAALTNSIWDLHYYNYIDNFQMDLASNLAAMNSMIATHTIVPFAVGGTPVVCICEYGNSTDGTNIDAGWMATVQAVNTDTNAAGTLYGSAAWNWDPGGSADQLQNGPPYNGTSLTAYGQLVAQYILAGPSPPIAPTLTPGAIAGATAASYTPQAGDVGNTLTISVTAHNGTGPSLPATSLATNAVVP
jgi:hypothetical protein